MTNKLLSLVILLVIVMSVRGQDLNYTLSDDSLVNKYASIQRVYYATRTELKPKIDGKLDDECWQKIGTWDGDFIQQQPHQAAPPSQETVPVTQRAATGLRVDRVEESSSLPDPSRWRTPSSRRTNWETSET